MRDGNAPKRQYADELKIDAIRLSDSVGGHEAPRRRGIPSATLRAQPVGLVPSPEAPAQALRRPVTELQAENSRLRKELVDAKLDVEILRKATVHFAKVSR